ncbi:hypothetical protein KVR01_012271 [Diaporthe batatas]|uniref:uncharacterized protein n=1 Tax=Diaporthe batatas TaxID=748121 RepID=UPI001D049408|nr:uncharacterized protein KVR01_012271 [Diaporthe batatas]KAG8157999.1 hypothetical protein KVR01_012271 [Diaporthe batatas]
MAPIIFDDGAPVQNIPAARYRKAETSRLRMTGDMVWDGRNLNSSQYTYQLTEAEIAEIERALDIFKGYGLDGPDISPTNFPLPSLGKKLNDFAHVVHAGTGFVVLAGLDPRKYTVEDNALLFLGVSSYIGEERGMQDNAGSMMVHVQDLRKNSRQGASLKSSNKATAFHAEFYCDILAFYVQEEPAEGGMMKLASSWQVYNNLCQAQPEVVEKLMLPDWKFESRGELFPACTRPLLFLEDRKAILNYSRRPLLGAHTRKTGDMMGNLTPDQALALMAVQDVATQACVCVPPTRGNMMFINNLGLLHAREKFRDDSEHARHIARLWLRNPELACNLPLQLERGHQTIYGENGLRERWNLVPPTVGEIGNWGDEGYESPSGGQGSSSKTSH